MNRTKTTIALLATLLAIVSCIGIFGDSFSRTTANVLVDFHMILNLPVYCLLYLVGIGPVFQVENGCLRLASPLPIAAIAVQCCLWTWLFLVLMRFEQHLKGRRSK